MGLSSIYIHWPFCKSKCPYCSFISFPFSVETDISSVCNCLITDLQLSTEKIDIRTIKTLYFGGGTPTLMPVNTVEAIINWLADKYGFDSDAEVTMEANPATFDAQRLKDLQSAGINRLSLGIQSFSDKNLKFLGRIYDSSQAMLAATTVADVFDNFSFDFMYGYDIQNLNELECDLQRAVNFGCKHISAYQLTFEEGTPFYDRLQNGDMQRIDENNEVAYSNFIRSFLASHSISMYEVSNYSVPGFESRHNLAYWNYDDYLGVGVGAHSRITLNGSKTEIIKMRDIASWMANVNSGAIDHSKPLDEIEQLEEVIIMGLRLVDGISFKTLATKTSQKLMKAVIERTSFLKQQHLIDECDDRIRLTRDGMMKLNSVVEYLLDIE